MPLKKYTLRVVTVSRKPERDPDDGIMRRPRLIHEVVARYEHQCAWCETWYTPEKSTQKYCEDGCRHSAFRERQRDELLTLRKQAKS